MKHQLPDGRWLMASYEDIRTFFRDNPVVGKVIQDIVPSKTDYCIGNLEDIEHILDQSAESTIDTDGFICLRFSDGSSLEVEFSGDGPIILGYNTASHFPSYNGSCYTLTTMFKHCLGKRIEKIAFETTNRKMLFPCYMGIDMSAEDDGVKQLRFLLEDGTHLSASGWIDWFRFSHKVSPEANKRVPYRELLRELDPKQHPFLRDLGDGAFVTMRSRQQALHRAILRDMQPIWKIRCLYVSFHARNQSCAYAVTIRKDFTASFAERNARFYECLQKSLVYGETLLCENQCYTVVGEFYRLTYVLEGYKKHPNQIGYVEAGQPCVSLLRRMSAEEAFRWMKDYREEGKLVQTQMNLAEMVQKYPNPSQRLIQIVKTAKRERCRRSET